MTTFVHPQYLVDSDWLAANLDNPSVRILDCTAMLTRDLTNRAESEWFDKGHIPGSQFFDVAAGKGVLSDPDADLPWTWPKVAHVERVMAQFGVSNDTRVILVARTPREGLDSGTMWCTRAWWTLHHHGVDCAILAGGIEGWEREGRSLSTESTAVTPGNFTSSENWARGRALRVDVERGIASSDTVVVDALQQGSYTGADPGYGPRKGHITGAVNLPFRDLVHGETAQFKSPQALHQALTEAGLIEASNVISYCGGAIAATVDAFALALFGHDSVAVYDGSLMEWSADPSLPMTDPVEEGGNP